jgi:penicillin-binding protein 1A
MSSSGSGRRSPQGGRRSLVADRRAAPTAPKPPSRGRATPSGSGTGGTTRRRKARAPRPRPRGPLAWIAAFFGLIWRIIWGLIWRGTVAVMLLLGAATAYYYAQLPDLAAAVDARSRGSVTMLDRNGNVFAWRGDQFGGVIDPDRQPASGQCHRRDRGPALLPPLRRQPARHRQRDPHQPERRARPPVGPWRVDHHAAGGQADVSGRALRPVRMGQRERLRTGLPPHHALAQDPGNPFALAMEFRYTKDEILSIYMNRAFLGAGSRGFEAAAQRYFATSSADLNPAQAAMLAGLLVAPSYYAPTRNLERAQRPRVDGGASDGGSGLPDRR